LIVNIQPKNDGAKPRSRTRSRGIAPSCWKKTAAAGTHAARKKRRFGFFQPGRERVAAPAPAADLCSTTRKPVSTRTAIAASEVAPSTRKIDGKLTSAR